MLRYSIVSSQQRLLSAARWRTTVQWHLSADGRSRLSGRKCFADSSRSTPSAATPATPSSQPTVTAESVPKTPPLPSGQGQKSSIPPPQPLVDNVGKISTPSPPSSSPPKTKRLRWLLLYLLITSGLAYTGSIWLALKSDNFHDFFTEYIPLGEECVLYFEERDFYRRFPNATRHPNRRLAVPREEHKITIPSKSGLSWKVAQEDTSSDVTRKGRHMSAVEETGQKGDAQSKATLTKSDGKTVLKPKSDRVVKDPAKTEAEKSQEKPALKENPKQDLKQESKQAHSQPATTLASKLELIKIKEGDDPVVQELVRIFNSIIRDISGNDSVGKHPVPVEKIHSELEKVGEKITILRKEAENAAEEEIRKAHVAFDESARDLIRQIDEARAAEAAQFREEFEAEREKLSLAYQDKIKTELQRAQELAEQRLRNELVEQAIELNRKYLNDVKGLVEKERQGRLSKLNELTANVNQLEKLTTGWNDVIDTNLKTQQLQVAIDAVRSVLESSDMPKPFVRELIAVKELASGDPVVTAAIASINPTAYQRGIPSTPRIVDRFRRVAGEVRKVSLLPEDAGIASHAASFVLSKVMFKKDELADGDDVESILTRTENLLEEGNLDAAAREMNTLQGWAKILSKDWLADVRRVLEVRQALEVIETEARLQCLKVEL